MPPSEKSEVLILEQGEASVSAMSANKDGLICFAGIGEGFCSEHYYAGWDGKGLDSIEDCVMVCISEGNIGCSYVSFFPGVTCSRYNHAFGEECTLNDDVNHETYKRKTPF